MRLLPYTDMAVTPRAERTTLSPVSVIASAARTCYQVRDGEGKRSDEELATLLIDNGHYSMLEFANFGCQIWTDRGVSHELVRHRLFSFAQESTRYCAYKDELTFFAPQVFAGESDGDRISVHEFYELAEVMYQRQLAAGIPAQHARDLLPTSLATHIEVQGNMREWRHFLDLRLSLRAHPKMRFIAMAVYREIYDWCPLLLRGLELPVEGAWKKDYAVQGTFDFSGTDTKNSARR